MKRRGGGGEECVMDQLVFDNFLADLDIYGKSGLRTLSDKNHTSAWLKATPLSNLGLSIPSIEVTVAAKTWLGIYCFIPFRSITIMPVVVCH